MVDIKYLKKQEEKLNIERKKAADERDVQKGKTIKIEQLFNAIEKIKNIKIDHDKFYNIEDLDFKILNENNDKVLIKNVIKKNKPVIEIEFYNGHKKIVANTHKFGNNKFAQDLIQDDIIPSVNNEFKVKMVRFLGEEFHNIHDEYTRFYKNESVYDFEVDSPTHLYQTSDSIINHNTGKSLLIGKFLGEAIKKGGIAFVVDTENAWNKIFIRKIVGDDQIADAIQINRKIDTIERLEVFLNRIINLATNQKWDIPVVIAIDSMSNLSTIHELKIIDDEKNEKRDMFKAGLIKRLFRVINRKLRYTNVTILTTQHLIANIGVMYGPAKTTSGGSGVPYASDIRLTMLSPKKIEHTGSNHPIGIRVHTKVAKNRIVGEGRSCYTNLIFKGGIDKFSGLFELLREYGVVSMHTKNSKFGESSDIVKETVVVWPVLEEIYNKFPKYQARKYYAPKDVMTNLKKDKNWVPELIPAGPYLDFKNKSSGPYLGFNVVNVQEFLNDLGEEFVLQKWTDEYNEIIEKQETPETFIVDSTGQDDTPDQDEQFAEQMLEEIEEVEKPKKSKK